MNKKNRKTKALILMILVFQLFVRENKVVQAENSGAIDLISLKATTESGEPLSKVYKGELFFLSYEVLETGGTNFAEAREEPILLGRIPAPFLIEEDQEVPVIKEGGGQHFTGNSLCEEGWDYLPIPKEIRGDGKRESLFRGILCKGDIVS